MSEESRFGELVSEFRALVLTRGGVIDSLLPPVAFLAISALSGFEYAMWGSLALALAIGVWRLLKRQSLMYALGGVGGVLFAILISRLLDRAEGFFLPGILSGALTVLLCFGSVLFRRPLVAWTSYIARRWPAGWYWHPRVRPAYSEVTLAWGVLFLVRLAVQLYLFQNEQAASLAVVQLVSGWPLTVVLLVISYLYGTWRLRRLQGPSVEEFSSGAEPPWTGQQRGF